MERDRVVITGINGFVGHHLARELHSKGVSVIGIGRDSEPDTDIIDVVDEYHQANLTKEWPETSMARAVINLAGLSAVGPSYEKPQLYYDTNTSIVGNLCDYYLSKKKEGLKTPRLLIVSSGAVYKSDQPMPIDEDGVVGHSSPYAISKVLNEKQAALYRSLGLDCVIARPFNHIGPGQEGGFILPDMYERIKALKANEDTIIAGNVETKRDYTDVRDIVKAYGKIALAVTLKHNLYNICSGKSFSGGEIFDTLKKAAGLPNIKYEIDQSLVRPTDTPDIIGSANRLHAELGWTPEIDILNQTIPDFVNSNVN